MNFQNLPSKIGFGNKSYSILSKEKDVLIISGSNADQKVSFEKIKKILKRSVFIHKLKKDRFDPKKVYNLVGSYKHKRISAIIAFGGGSVIDFSKLVIKEFRNVKKKHISFYVIPTLLGSGAESSMTAILNTKKEKIISTDDSFLPDGIIYDFSLYKNLKRERIILGHLDALTHCLESLNSINKNPFSEFLAKSTLENFIKQFKEIDPFKNIDSTSLKELSVLSLNGGICQNNAGAGITHALAHTLESKIKTSHVACVSYFLKDVIYYLAQEDKNFILNQDKSLKKHINKYTNEARRYPALQEINKYLKNGEKIDLIIKDAKKDPCWRLFEKKINEEKLKKIILKNL